MNNLAALAAEQHILQFDGNTNRCGTVQEYSDCFDFYSMNFRYFRDKYKPYLKMLLLEKLESKDRVVWIDSGCGNEIALREAKISLEKDGIQIDRLVTYGIDILPFDKPTVKYHIREGYVHQRVLEKKFAPQRITGNIETVVFPETPDIVTGHNVLFWTPNPLHAFLNAYNQSAVGTTLMFNVSNVSRYTTLPFLPLMSKSIFSKLFRENPDKLHIHQNTGGEFVVEKTSNDSLRRILFSYIKNMEEKTPDLTEGSDIIMVQKI